jgi:hypothetical protein
MPMIFYLHTFFTKCLNFLGSNEIYQPLYYFQINQKLGNQPIFFEHLGKNFP